ncbi:MAG TPA: hypothetical protein VNQ52_02185 [Microbacteriaceae bacterium]|nr:hypothetical protein [Microbacteriaceae bacterium]
MTTWILVGAAGILAVVLLWGLVSPRTQWRVLVGWSARDPDRAEPGDGVHGITRIVCLIGLLGIAAFAGVQIWSAVSDQPRPAPEGSAVEAMWGSPVPRLIDRVVAPVAAPPADLVAGPITGYQELERGWAPDYLVGVPRWSFLAEPVPTGLIGSYPGDGFTAYGISDILVAAQGPLTCIPRVAAAEETEGLITVSVYWGLPGAADQDSLTACSDMGGLLQTVLIPLQLSAPVDGRNVVTFEGSPVVPVRVIG